MLSLVTVFIVLLVFIFIADIKISRANGQKVRYERELNDRLLIDALELKRIGELKDRFLASVTHELMTPLTSITAFTGILIRNRDGNLTKRNIDHLQVMKRNAVQLKSLLGNLLELSELNESGYELTYARFNLRQMLDEVTEAFMPVILKKDHEITLEYDDADAIVEADDTRVKQEFRTYSPTQSCIHHWARTLPCRHGSLISCSQSPLPITASASRKEIRKNSSPCSSAPTTNQPDQ